MSEKCLLDQWRDMAYDRNLSKEQLESFWGKYFTIETSIYEQLLDDPDTEVKGTVKELAEKYGQDVMTMVGFLDGINDSLKTPNPIETMTEDKVRAVLTLMPLGGVWLDGKRLIVHQGVEIVDESAVE